MEDKIKKAKSFRFTALVLAFGLFLVAILTSCSPAPTPSPTLAPPTPIPPTAIPTQQPAELPSATPNALGLVFIAQYDATRQVLTIYGTTPGATIVMGGTPLPLPPTATPTFTPTPTGTSTLTPTSTNVPTRAPRPPTETPVVYTAQALRGKIIFKTTRDGGSFNNFQYYMMNPDGSGQQRLEFQPADDLAAALNNQAAGVENVEPGGARRVFGDRHCYGSGTCSIYILDTQLNASIINSDEDISVGNWFPAPGAVAVSKDPAWSPSGNYIAFVSNHDPGSECRKSLNVFKGTPSQNPTIRRLTSFCAGGNVDKPSFRPDGEQLVFWADDGGLRQLFVLDVGSDDTFDYRFSNPHKISDGLSNDWDPTWVK